jgi:hypothetical protein
MQNVPRTVARSKYQPTWSLPSPAEQAALWEAHMLQSGCQLATTHYVSVEPDAIVALGNRSIADEQRAADGENLAALVCGYR